MENCMLELIFPDPAGAFPEIGYILYGEIQPDTGRKFEWVPRNAQDENWGLAITRIGSGTTMHDLGDAKAIFTSTNSYTIVPDGMVTDSMLLRMVLRDRRYL